MASELHHPLQDEDISMVNIENEKSKRPNVIRGHEITSRTITTPPFSYVCLELISDPPTNINLDNLTVRSYLTASFSQFLGLMGSAISVDILKVDGRECWIRIPREDLSAVVAAVGGWIGNGQNDVKVGWNVRRSGNWLGSLVGAKTIETTWTG